MEPELLAVGIDKPRLDSLDATPAVDTPDVPERDLGELVVIFRRLPLWVDLLRHEAAVGGVPDDQARSVIIGSR